MYDLKLLIDTDKVLVSNEGKMAAQDKHLPGKKAKDQYRQMLAGTVSQKVPLFLQAHQGSVS